MSPEDVTILVYLAAFVIGLAVLFALLRLFSIDKTLKDIRDELRGEAGDSERQKARETLAKYGHQIS